MYRKTKKRERTTYGGIRFWIASGYIKIGTIGGCMTMETKYMAYSLTNV
jgi:hypothetical protein